MSADTPSNAAARRAPSRMDLVRLTWSMHGRAIAWVAGLLILTLGLATVGILRTITVGDAVVHEATVIDVPSNQSIHVQVEFGDGERAMIPRGRHEDLLVGDVVTVTETSSGLGTTGFTLSEVVDP